MQYNTSEDNKMIEKIYTIEEVCEMLKVSKKSLHLWEKQGRIVPLRTFGGHRRYTEAMIKSVLGMPTKDAEE